MISKQCQLCKHHVFTLRFDQQTVLCRPCQTRVDMAADQLTKCIKYYRHLNLDEIAEELGISKRILLILQEDGRLEAIHNQYHNHQCSNCQQPLHDPNRNLCSHCVLQSAKQPNRTKQRIDDQRRRAEVKKQIMSSLSSNRPKFSAS